MNTEPKLHEHNEYINAGTYLNGIAIYEKIIETLGNFDWELKFELSKNEIQNYITNYSHEFLRMKFTDSHLDGISTK